MKVSKDLKIPKQIVLAYKIKITLWYVPNIETIFDFLNLFSKYCALKKINFFFWNCHFRNFISKHLLQELEKISYIQVNEKN